MAGHSKWSNIKHRKARQDAVRGKLWSKCSRAIIVAARDGADPKFNVALRYAIDEAKEANMPKDTIEKAIKKGAGELEGQRFESVRYEGYGPAGVAIIIDCLTDNVNRTAPEIRAIFDKQNGNLAKPGAVAFGFTTRGIIHIETDKISEDRLMELALEAGADDISESDGAWQVSTDPGSFLSVKDALKAATVEIAFAEIAMVPANSIDCNLSTATKIMRLIDALEDLDDVQKVFHNANIPDEVMASMK